MAAKNPTLDQLAALNQSVIDCQRCPRLVEHRQQVAQTKKRAYREQTYWDKPVPGWGDPHAKLLIVGLAPGAHGANRTGIPFGGDSSGNILLSALQKAGFARLTGQPSGRPDRPANFQLKNSYLTNAVRCVSPANLPKTHERDNCLPYLALEIACLQNLQVILALGGYAFSALLLALQHLGIELPRPRPQFSHASVDHVPPYTLVCSYHPSQRNTQTGLLTAEMLDQVVAKCNDF